jgi:hypothetical protein
MMRTAQQKRSLGSAPRKAAHRHTRQQKLRLSAGSTGALPGVQRREAPDNYRENPYWFAKRLPPNVSHPNKLDSPCRSARTHRWSTKAAAIGYRTTAARIHTPTDPTTEVRLIMDRSKCELQQKKLGFSNFFLSREKRYNFAQLDLSQSFRMSSETLWGRHSP